jgi:hypothetical protein
MPYLPTAIMPLLASFRPVFSRRVWRHVPLLVIGAILTPGARQVTRVLRVMGHADTRSYQSYHRVLNRAVWSSLAASQILLGLLVLTFAPDGPLVVGIDETIERRWGKGIQARGRYRDPIRSKGGRVVMVWGLRWISMMLLVPIPWADRVWALPFLTVLAPSERACGREGRRYKPIWLWARQLIRLLHRWQPQRQVVIVGDGTYACMELLLAVSRLATVVTRLRLDAQLYAPPPDRQPGTRGRPRRVGHRLPGLRERLDDSSTEWTAVELPRWYGGVARTVELCSAQAHWYHKSGRPAVPLRWVLIRDPQEGCAPLALLCTDQAADPRQIVTWYVQRWSLEVTFHEARAHLGVETQRQWSERAIARTTPALLGLFSLVTLAAHPVMNQAAPPVRQAAWYAKAHPTFADALAVVRRALWLHEDFPFSAVPPETVQIPRALLDRLTDTLAYAA